jgi:hypothetical protein
MVATFTMGADLAVQGVDNVAVNMEYPANRPANVAPLASDGALFKPDALTPHTFTSWLDPAKSLDYQYQMQVHFSAQSDWVGKEAKVVSPWIVSRARQLAIDPLDVIGLLDLPISIGTLDPVVSQVQVEVAYDDPANAFNVARTFVLKAGDPAAHWKLRLSDPGLRTYRYRVTYIFKDNARYTTAWVTSVDESLVINDPFQGRIDLRLVPVLDVANLQEADVEVLYQEPDTGYEHRSQVTFTGPTLVTQAVSIPTLARAPAGYTYTTPIVRADGSVNSPAPVSATVDDTAVAIHDGIGTTRRILVKLVDPTLADGGLLAIKVTLTAPGGDQAEVIFTPSQTADQRVTLVSPDAMPWHYQYSVTGYSAKGLPKAGDSGDSGDAQLLVRLPGT